MDESKLVKIPEEEEEDEDEDEDEDVDVVEDVVDGVSTDSSLSKVQSVEQSSAHSQFNRIRIGSFQKRKQSKKLNLEIINCHCN